MRARVPPALLFSFVVGLLLLFSHAGDFDYPTDNDQANYLLVARQLAEGQGLTTPVVWHHLRAEARVGGPSNDYWMPMTSLAMAPAMAVLPDNYWAAMISSVLWSALGVGLACLVIGRLTGSLGVGALGACALASHPAYRFYGATGDSSALYACLLLGAALLWDQLSESEGADRKRAVGLGVLAGLAVLTRNDALVGLGAAVVVALVHGRIRKVPCPPRPMWPWVVGGAALVLLPWVLRNALEFGSLWNPASGKVGLFSLSMRDVYAFGETPSPSGQFAAVGQAPLAGLGLRLRSIAELGWAEATAFSPYLLPLTLLGCVRAYRTKSAVGGLLLAYLVAFPMVYGLIAARLGFLPRTTAAALPALIGFALLGAQWLVSACARRWSSAAPSRRVLFAGWVCAVGLILGWSEWARLSAHPFTKQLPGEYARVELVLRELGCPPSAPVLTTQPWQFAWSTRRPAVMLPTNGLEATRAAARAHGARYVLFTGYGHPELEWYAELNEVWSGRTKHPAFRLVYQRGFWRLFAIDSGG